MKRISEERESGGEGVGAVGDGETDVHDDSQGLCRLEMMLVELAEAERRPSAGWGRIVHVL